LLFALKAKHKNPHVGNGTRVPMFEGDKPS
jgi:hypothetical protein